jgi:hypothetical protein
MHVIDVVGIAINKQSGETVQDLRRNQARAAIESLSNMLELAIENSETPLGPSATDIINVMRLLARTPSDYL